MEIARFIDDIYPKAEITHTRRTVRAFVEREDGKIGLLYLFGEDMFGVRDHYETPGGGIEEGETLEEALSREVQEELGYKVISSTCLGVIIDQYNMIGRETISTFFHCRVDTSSCRTNRTEMEKALVKEVRWFTPAEALNELKTHIVGPCGLIVQRRDAAALEYYLKNFSSDELK